VSLFDRLVEQAMGTKPELVPVRAVVEKELLHHDILREMSVAGLLAGLTFIGGTCLRACYGSPRLSEDLDFTGGREFTREALSALAGVLTDRLQSKYSLEVKVSAPVKETVGVDTWKITIITRPEKRGLPAQRLHVDICAIPSHSRRPMMLRNVYSVDMGTSGLILQAQSREEILADKFLALAFRPNRIKNRDLWDIVWLKQQGVELPLALIPAKIVDHRRNVAEFSTILRSRLVSLKDDPGTRSAFVKEMQRFLPSTLVAETVEQEPFWAYLVDLVSGECGRAIAAFPA